MMILSVSVQSETKDKSHDRAEHLFPPLGLDLPQVELQLLALQHIAVRPAALAGPGGDGTQHTSSQKLVDETLLNLAVLLSLLVLLVRLLRALLVEVGLLLLGQLGTLLAAQRHGVVRLVPLSERSGVHHDDGILDESLGTDQLVVAGIVHYVDDPELAADCLAAPGEVAVVETESAVLLVAAADAEGVDPLGGELGHGGRPGQLELPLLPDGAALAASSAALVPVIPGDTHPAPLNKCLSCRSESSN